MMTLEIFPPMKCAALICAVLSASASYAAESCEAPTRIEDVVSSSATALEPQRFLEISAKLVTAEILRRLGPAAREIGSGLIVLEWDVTDGSVFVVSASDLCATPYRVGFSKRKTMVVQ